MGVESGWTHDETADCIIRIGKWASNDFMGDERMEGGVPEAPMGVALATQDGM